MTRDDVLALLDRRRDALARRDMAAFAELYAANARLESPLAGAVTGRDNVATATAVFYTAFPDAVVTEEPPIIDGNRVVIVAEAVGTHVGTIMGLEPSGRSFRFALTFVLELGADAIVRERRIYDFTGLLVQIGVLKAKPA
jgi:predicted ester cyclase